jgi:hypothetical protein
LRGLLSVLAVVYLIGVGVALVPTVRDNWNHATVSQIFVSVVLDLPRAVGWPARAYRDL